MIKWTEDEWRDYVTAEREYAFFSGRSQGSKEERERIVGLLRSVIGSQDHFDQHTDGLAKAVELIVGETNV